jgi:hypothetical protein
MGDAFKYLVQVHVTLRHSANQFTQIWRPDLRETASI